MFNKKNNFVVHYGGEKKGFSRKTWFIIGCVAGVIALAVALILLIPKFTKNGDNNEGIQNNNQTPNAEPQVESIYVSATPDKTVYYVGDTPNYSGLVIGVSHVGDKVQRSPMMKPTVS